MMSNRSNKDNRVLTRRSSALLLAITAIILGAWIVDLGIGNAPITGAAENEAPMDKPEGEEPKKPENPFPNRVALPAGVLDGGREWLNASGPISLRDLKGKVVLLDFWTYCCINCMHVLPDLEFLEQKYARELVVVGVHSAKFDNEKDSENIRRAIQRYEIAHPVINDADMVVWRAFGARSWPTLVIVDPEGYYCGYISGEGHRELLDDVVGRVVAYHRSKGTLDETPVHFALESEKLKPTPLRFPAKLLADEAGGRLFISDSNHNRIVIVGLDGQVQDVIGTGTIGAGDGSYGEAQFYRPQGMALVRDTLYVADTENHLLRTVNLKSKTVSTLAGTGKQARSRENAGMLRELALNSPWDLAVHDGVLYIAMAGPHQIWSHKLGADTIQVFAGTGREDIIDGPWAQSALAQPSGFALDDSDNLYVADSEGSSIRRIDLKPDGKVTTIAGTHDLPSGRSLFAFGDQDGPAEESRLQHPLGVAWHQGTLYVTDTYNHKVKKIRPTDGSGNVQTWLGDGNRGDQLDPPRFSEPSGISIAGGRAYIADTNNHRIVIADLKSGKVTPFEIKGLEPPAAPAVAPANELAEGEAKVVPAQEVAKADKLHFDVAVKLPEGFKFNQQAPVSYTVSATEPQTLVAEEHLGKRQKGALSESGVTVALPLANAPGKGTFDVAVTFGYCRDGSGGLCKMGTFRWQVPVSVVAESGEQAVRLEAVAE